MYQTRQQAWFSAFVGIGLVVLLGSYIVKEIGRHDVAEWRRTLLFAVFGALIAVVSAIFLWRGARAGVRVDDDGALVRNMFRSRHLKWREIEGFEVEPYAGTWTIGSVRLRDGTSMRIWGIQGRNTVLFPNNAWAQTPIDELNELLNSRRDAAEPRGEMAVDKRPPAAPSA